MKAGCFQFNEGKNHHPNKAKEEKEQWLTLY